MKWFTVDMEVPDWQKDRHDIPLRPVLRELDPNLSHSMDGTSFTFEVEYHPV